MQYNRRDLPEEYLLAKFAFTKDEILDYKDYMERHKFKDDERRNTNFHFNKADMFNNSQSSFN
jgi:hypothetical protein